MFIERHEELFKEFLKEKRFLKNISPKTEDYYNQAWTAYKRYAPDGIKVDFTQGQLNKWVVAMCEAGIKPKSCNTFLGLFPFIALISFVLTLGSCVGCFSAGPSLYTPFYISIKRFLKPIL